MPVLEVACGAARTRLRVLLRARLLEATKTPEHSAVSTPLVRRALSQFDLSPFNTSQSKGHPLLLQGAAMDRVVRSVDEVESALRGTQSCAVSGELLEASERERLYLERLFDWTQGAEGREGKAVVERRARSGARVVWRRPKAIPAELRAGLPELSRHALQDSRLAWLNRAYARVNYRWGPAHEETESQAALRRQRLFCMLERYSAVGGPGYQGAVPPEVIGQLEDSMAGPRRFRRQGPGLRAVEAFSSPLNHRMPPAPPPGRGRAAEEDRRDPRFFFSAFEDCDRHFGSRGSFLHAHGVAGLPRVGEGELRMPLLVLNPPYCPHLLLDAVQQVEGMMAQRPVAGREAGAPPRHRSTDHHPLTALFVVPMHSAHGRTGGHAFTEDEFLQRLARSSLVRAQGCLAPHEHRFVKGDEYQRTRTGERLHVATFQTGVFLLQNESAAALSRFEPQKVVDSLVTSWQSVKGTRERQPGGTGRLPGVLRRRSAADRQLHMDSLKC